MITKEEAEEYHRQCKLMIAEYEKQKAELLALIDAYNEGQPDDKKIRETYHKVISLPKAEN